MTMTYVPRPVSSCFHRARTRNEPRPVLYASAIVSGVSTMMPPVGKSGPLTYFSSVLLRAFGLSMRNSAASHSSAALCGGMDGRHADCNALRAVGKQIGKGRRQHHRLFIGAVIGRAKINRVLVDAVDQQPRHFGEPRLGVAHGGGVIAVDVSEVALPVHERIALGEIPARAAPARRRSPGRRAGGSCPSRRRRPWRTS